MFEANTIAAELRAQHITTASFGERVQEVRRERGWASLENAGIPLRFVAVLLDALVFVPLFIVLGLMRVAATEAISTAKRTLASTWAGRSWLLLIALGIAYYVVCESAAGATLGSAWSGSASSGKTVRP